MLRPPDWLGIATRTAQGHRSTARGSGMSENTPTTPMATETAIAFLKEASRYFAKVGHSGEDAGFWAAQQNSINCLKIVALIEELSAHTPSIEQASS